METNKSIETLVEEILKYESNISNLLTGIIQIKQEILLQIEVFVKEWYDEKVKNEVIKRPEHTKYIGVEQLKKLKDELRILIDNVPNLIDAYLVNNGIWKHEQLEIDEVRYNSGVSVTYKLKQSFLEEIKRLFEDCGKLLMKYGYVGSKYYNPDWNIQHNSDKIVYTSKYDISKPLEKLINQYENKLINLCNEAYLLNKAKSEKEQVEALNLWDEA